MVLQQSLISTTSVGMEDAIQPNDFPVGNVQDIVDRLPKYFTICVASKRNSGKSVLVMELIQDLMRQRKVDMVVVMSADSWKRVVFSNKERGEGPEAHTFCLCLTTA